MLRVLVTGGTGFLGGHLVEGLLARGDRVRVLAHTEPDGKDERVETIWGDVRDRATVDRAVDQMDAVIHTVSNFRKAGSDRKEAHAVNVTGSIHVCEAAAAAGVSHLVHCSTIGVHGSVKQVPADEETPFNPGDLYQVTKLEAEQAVRRRADELGLRTTVIRPISMFGPGDTRMLKLFRMIKRGKFLMVGRGEALFQPAYIDDVVRGFLTCLENERAYGKVFIVGGDEYVPLTRLVEIIAEELEVPVPKRRVPLAPVLAAATVCEWLCAPFGIEPPLHRRRVSFFQNNRAFRIDRIRHELGYEPQISLREGLRRTIRWYDEHGWL